MTRSPWRAAPIALTLSIAFEIAWKLITIANGRSSFIGGATWNLVENGLFFAVGVLATVGAGELVRRTHGSRQLGARIAMFGLGAMVALQVCDQFAELALRSDHMRTWYEADAWLWPLATLVVSVGFAIAAWRDADPDADADSASQRRAAGIAVIVVTAISSPLPPLRDVLFHSLGLDFEQSMVLYAAVSTLRLVLCLVLAGFAARDTIADAGEPGHVTAALRTIATTLTARVWVAAIGACVMLFAGMASSGEGEGMFTMLRFWVVAAAAVNAIAIAVFGSGVLRLARGLGPDEPRGRTYFAAAVMLGATAVSAIQAAWLVKMFYGGDDGNSQASAFVSAAPLVVPVLSTLGMMLVLHAIATVARRRDQPTLANAATSYLAPVAIMSGIAVMITVYGLPTAHSTGTAIGMLLASAIIGLMVFVYVARLCRRAADDFEAGAPLPVATATIRS